MAGKFLGSKIEKPQTPIEKWWNETNPEILMTWLIDRGINPWVMVKRWHRLLESERELIARFWGVEDEF